MSSTQRWMILGGAAVAVVIIGVFIFFLTRPPAAVTAEFDGVVARGEGRDFSLKEVQVRDSTISLCSQEDLSVRVEREPVALRPGDRVTVKGDYDGKECRVMVKSTEHYVKVTVPARRFRRCLPGLRCRPCQLLRRAACHSSSLGESLLLAVVRES